MLPQAYAGLCSYLVGWLLACLLACSADCGVWLSALPLAGGLLAAESEGARVLVG